jgi:ADP-heptose:LPS heptosyltransferase
MKILVIRFSSIGDVVLTTSVVRCLKLQTNAEIHFITKEGFKSVLKDNPYIDKLITIKSSIKEVEADLKKEQYDWIIDLHKNIRTLSLKQKLKVPSRSFPKLNKEKWLLVKFKINKMPKLHIVDRYFETVKHLGVVNDNLPGDFFIAPESEVNIQSTFSITEKFVAIAIGAQFATKRLPFEKLKEVISKINSPIILVGGPTDTELATSIVEAFPSKQILNACGGLSLQQSASIVSQASVLLTNDTGLMHIAACFKIPIVSVWGNTVPELGMYPYLPNHSELYSIHQVENLSCRPCSKIGYKKCPKGHFNCMNLQDTVAIADDVNLKIL